MSNSSADGSPLGVPAPAQEGENFPDIRLKYTIRPGHLKREKLRIGVTKTVHSTKK